MNLYFTFIIILILILSINLYNSYVLSETKIVWSIHSNPSKLIDWASDVCIDDKYIYIIGWESISIGDTAFRVEKRYRVNGSLVTSWSFNPSNSSDEPYSCTIYGKRLYIVGFSLINNTYKWTIISLDLDFMNYSYIHQDFNGIALSITSYRDYLYVAGIYNVSGDTEILIEKIDPNLSPIKIYRSNPSNATDIAIDIKINPYMDRIFITGTTEGRGLIGSWYIEILDYDLNTIERIVLPVRGFASSITFDENGYTYISGSLDSGAALVKLDIPTKNIILMKKIPGSMSRIIYVNGFLAVLTSWFYGNTTLYIFDSDFNILDLNVLDTRSIYWWGNIRSYNNMIYIAIPNILTNITDIEWSIFAIDISNILPRITTVIEMKTIVTPITTTINFTYTLALTRTIPTTLYLYTTVLETLTTSYAMTIRETITRTNTTTSTLTLMFTKILTERETETMTKTLHQIDINMTIVISIIVLIIGFTIGYISKRILK